MGEVVDFSALFVGSDFDVPLPDNFRVNVLRGDSDRAVVALVSVEGPAVFLLANKAVFESVGDFSFISCSGTVAVEG